MDLEPFYLRREETHGSLSPLIDVSKSSLFLPEAGSQYVYS